MGSDVNSYSDWYKKTWEEEIPDDVEFGKEGKTGIIMCEFSSWSKGIWVGAQRYWSNRGETRPVSGTYDKHIYWSPSEFENWEQGEAFADLDTRGMRWYWRELSGGLPVVILVPGKGETQDHKSAELIAWERVWLDLVSIPEFQEIQKAKAAGQLGKIPKEVIASLKAKTLELDIDRRSKDIFDGAPADPPEFTKEMVKKCWEVGLVSNP